MKKTVFGVGFMLALTDAYNIDYSMPFRKFKEHFKNKKSEER